MIPDTVTATSSVDGFERVEPPVWVCILHREATQASSSRDGAGQPASSLAAAR